MLFPASGFEYFERLRHASVFHDRIEVRPVPVEGDGPALTDAMMTLRAVRLDHDPETFGWRIEEPDGRTCWPTAWRRRESGARMSASSSGPAGSTLPLDGSRSTSCR